MASCWSRRAADASLPWKSLSQETKRPSRASTGVISVVSSDPNALYAFSSLMTPMARLPKSMMSNSAPDLIDGVVDLSHVLHSPDAAPSPAPPTYDTRRAMQGVPATVISWPVNQRKLSLVRSASVSFPSHLTRSGPGHRQNAPLVGDVGDGDVLTVLGVHRQPIVIM